MIRASQLTFVLVILCASAAFGQATRTSDEYDPAAVMKESMAILRRAEQTQARSEAAYRQQLADYNRHADAQDQEYRRQYDDSQNRSQLVYVICGGAIVLMVVWGVFMTRKSHRKQDAAVAAIETGRVQSEQMIQALHAIASKLDEVKALLSSGNRG
jgi:hypothetical protein